MGINNIPKEVEIQELIYKKLYDLNINPFSVICTFGLGFEGLVSITVYIKSEIKEILDLLNYKSICDKSGYIILEDNNTIIFTGMALINLYSKLLQS